MSYNFYSGCRVRFSPCQYYKVQEILLGSGCRDDLCYTDAGNLFQSTVVNNTNSPYQEICAGEAIPTLNPGKTITKFDGSTYSLDGFFFYANQNDAFASRLNATPTNSYTPTAALVDVNTPGTYDVWVSEANTIADPPCKVQCTITVLADAGDGTPTISALTGNTTINLSAPGSVLGTNEIIGWWITEDNPISTTATNQTTLDAALPGSVGGIVSNPVNNIFASTSNDIDYTLSMDCNNLDNAKSYYATPVVSKDNSSAPSYTYTTSTAIPDNNGSTGTYPISVSGLDGAAVLEQVCVFIDHPFINDLNVYIQAPDGAQATLVTRYFTAGQDIGTAASPACFFAPGSGGYDVGSTSTCNGANPPCLTGSLDSEGSWTSISSANNGTWNLLIEDAGNTGTNGTIEFVELTFNPPPSGTTFPDITYSPCVFGNPVTITCSALLPIELLDFNGKQVEDYVALSWETANETNNDYFIIEKSIDGKTFSQLSTVDGAGNSTETIRYDDRDLYPVTGINYYRLIQVDFDGTMTTSSVVAVNFKAPTSINIRPNPSYEGNFNFDFETLSSGFGELSIFEISGRQVYATRLELIPGKNTATLSIPTLPEGIFIAQWRAGNTVESIRFVNIK